ncbi:MAG: ATP-binding cassette domain-containing protein [Bdellovibrionales bacterium]|nr:ATP-binding cassette domain-containing protein [Bdellovibrionales bacterium]
MASEIKLDRVNLYFEDNHVLKDVSISIQAGESVAIIGPSGSGKSTLLKVMAGLILPTSGKSFYKGRDSSTLSDSERLEIQKSMGMLFQKNALFDSLSVIENVTFPLSEVTDLSEESQIDRAKKYLKSVGLDHVLKLFPDEISGGMQKRLGIARALALDPKFVFYDDPTAGLDPITSRTIIQLILDLKNQLNSTIVVVTNEMNRAYQLADRIFLIIEGRLIEAGTVEETKNHKDPSIQQFINGGLVGPLTEAK